MGAIRAGLRDWWRRNRVTSIRLAVGAVATWVGCVGLEALLFGYNGPWIRFYGRVIDREGRPVDGKVVHVMVERRICRPGRHDVGPTVETLYLTPTTGEDGRFEVRGVRGVVLRVQTYPKDRYVLRDPRNSGWVYRYEAEDAGHAVVEYRPDARRPEVFVVER